MKSESENKKESPSVRLMKLLEKMEMQQWNPYNLSKYAMAVIFFLSLSLIVCYYQIGFNHTEENNGYHKEILPSRALSYIKDGKPVRLVDGSYPVAMPSQDFNLELKDKKVFPLFLVLVPNYKPRSTEIEDFELYPINIADDSILPRRGRTLALHILFGFTSDHAENTLLYAEKGNDTAAEDYKRKAFYYLVVKNGYGKMERDYMTPENAGEDFKYYRDVEHFKEELIAIYRMKNNITK